MYGFRNVIKDVLDNVYGRIVPGTIIIFDEFVLYDNWQLHEFKAFQEAVAMHRWEFEYLAISMFSKQAVVRIIDIKH